MPHPAPNYVLAARREIEERDSTVRRRLAEVATTGARTKGRDVIAIYSRQGFIDQRQQHAAEIFARAVADGSAALLQQARDLAGPAAYALLAAVVIDRRSLPNAAAHLGLTGNQQHLGRELRKALAVLADAWLPIPERTG